MENNRNIFGSQLSTTSNEENEMDKEIKITVTLRVQTSQVNGLWSAKALHQNGTEYYGTEFGEVYSTEASAIKALKKIIKDNTPD